MQRMEEDTASRVVNSNPTIIKEATSLPDFVHNGGQEQNSAGGKTIVVNHKPATTGLQKGAGNTSAQSTIGKKTTGATSSVAAKKK
jgi:hypothetical protein